MNKKALNEWKDKIKMINKQYERIYGSQYYIKRIGSVYISQCDNCLRDNIYGYVYSKIVRKCRNCKSIMSTIFDNIK